MAVRRRRDRDPETGEVRETWMIDVRFTHADGRKERVRARAPVQTRRGAEEYERQVRASLLDGTFGKVVARAPTLAEFAPRFIEGHAEANRQKASGIESKRSHLRTHLLPRLGGRPLDQITEADVQALKGALRKKAPKTVNNVLSTLNKLLKVAVKWGARGGGIDALPVQIELLKTAPAEMEFYEEEVFQRLVDGAAAYDERAGLTVLLGGDAGLRMGEMAALEWGDLDFKRGHLHVRRQEWRGVVGLPKGGKPRTVPMTDRLASALLAHRHLRGPRVLLRDDGRSVTRKVFWLWVRAGQRRAGMEQDGKIHVLRHTFCSRLAAAGVPAKAIQELAGHVHITTTQRYMHLAPAAKDAAIVALEALQRRGTAGAQRRSAEEES